MVDFIFACEVRQIDSNDYVLTGYDFMPPPYSGYWISYRAVKISKDFFDAVFIDILNKTLESTKIIDINTLNEKDLMKKWLKFCGFQNLKKLDNSSKMVFVRKEKNGLIELIPTHLEENQGFIHLTQYAKKLSPDDKNFLQIFKELMSINNQKTDL